MTERDEARPPRTAVSNATSSPLQSWWLHQKCPPTALAASEITTACTETVEAGSNKGLDASCLRLEDNNETNAQCRFAYRTVLRGASGGYALGALMFGVRLRGLPDQPAGETAVSCTSLKRILLHTDDTRRTSYMT